jgi:superfamily I DNA and/or RNA helicase
MREAAKGVAAFDYVIVDEAANALEPATLIPLSLLKPSV